MYTGLAVPEPGETTMPGGGMWSCSSERPSRLPRPIITGMSSTREGPGRYSVLVRGEVRDVDRVTRVAVRTPTGETELAYGNGFFLGELPNGTAPSSDELPPGGPYTIVAYDAGGNEVATERLQTLRERFGADGR